MKFKTTLLAVSALIGLPYAQGASSTEHKRYWISEYSQMFISIPVKEEQIKITQFSNQSDNQINLLTNQIDKSKTWKKGLLQKMFV